MELFMLVNESGYCSSTWWFKLSTRRVVFIVFMRVSDGKKRISGLPVAQAVAHWCKYERRWVVGKTR